MSKMIIFGEIMPRLKTPSRLYIWKDVLLFRKHAISGEFNHVSVFQVEALMKGCGHGRA